MIGSLRVSRSSSGSLSYQHIFSPGSIPCPICWGRGHPTKEASLGDGEVRPTLGTSSLTLSTSPLISLISSLHLSSPSLTPFTASSTSPTTPLTLSLSPSIDSESFVVWSWSSERSRAASSYCSEREAEVDWNDVVEGGWRWGRRYFCGV